MKKILITAVVLTLAVPALAAQQDIAQLSAVTANREALRTAINTQLSAVQSNFDEVYAVIDAGPVYVNTTAPADTKVVWIDTGQDNAIKVYVGGAWTVVGSGGIYTLPTAAADTLGGVKVGSRLTITDGVLSADVQTTDISGKEDLLGNPSTNGYVLSSTTAGVRSWIEMTGGGAGIAHATSDGNYYASKDGGWASLAGVFLNPSGSADLLTVTDTNDNFATDTVGASLNQLGNELADVTEITLDANTLAIADGVLSVVSADLLTITDTGTYFTTDTVGAALQELGGAPELFFDSGDFVEDRSVLGKVTVSLAAAVAGDDLGSATASDVANLFSGLGDYLKADGSTGTPTGGSYPEGYMEIDGGDSTSTTFAGVIDGGASI